MGAGMTRPSDSSSSSTLSSARPARSLCTSHAVGQQSSMLQSAVEVLCVASAGALNPCRLHMQCMLQHTTCRVIDVVWCALEALDGADGLPALGDEDGSGREEVCVGAVGLDEGPIAGEHEAGLQRRVQHVGAPPQRRDPLLRTLAGQLHALPRGLLEAALQQHENI